MAELLTVQQLSELSGFSIATIYRLVETGQIATIRTTIGPSAKRKTRGRIRIARADWEQFLARHRTPAQAEHAVPLRRVAGDVSELAGWDRYK